LKALRYLQPNVLQSAEIDLPICNAGEALVRVYSAGICGSDMAIYSGMHPRATPPLTMGHEFSGEIVEMNPTGSNIELTVGDHVTAYPLLVCGKCWACRNGCEHVCRDLKLIGIDRDGAFADYVTVPLNLLVKMSDNLTFDQGALIEPLAVGIHSLEMAGVPNWQTAAVIGMGPIGLLVALCLKHAGVENIVVSDINPYRLKRAETQGFTPFNSAEGNLAESVSAITEGEGADIVFECAGSASAALQMFELVRPRGQVIMVSVHKQPHPVDLRALNFKEVAMTGTRVYTRDDYQKALAIIRNIPVHDVISHHVDLSQGQKGFDLINQSDDVCKVIIKME